MYASTAAAAAAAAVVLATSSIIINYTSALSQTTTTTTAPATFDQGALAAANQSATQRAPQSSSWLAECQPGASGGGEGGSGAGRDIMDEAAADQQQQQLYVNLSTFWYCFLALITAVGLLISLISNMIIIYLFTSTPFLRKNPSNIIAVNLSLSDLLYCVQWPSVIYCSLTQSTWILEYSFVCQSFGFITVSTALASILTVLAMSIERAIVILYSIHARNKFTIRLAWMITVLIWIVSLSSCLPPLFGKFNRYTLDPSKTSCTLDYLSRHANYRLYILVLYVAYWIVPTILISISYITIIVTFKKSSLDLKKISDKTYAPSSSSSVLRLSSRNQNHLCRRLRDSLRLKGSALNSMSADHDHNRLHRPLYERRASISVFSSSIHGASSSDHDHHDAGSSKKQAPSFDKRKLFKRVVSSSVLPSCVFQQTDTSTKKGNNAIDQESGFTGRGVSRFNASLRFNSNPQETDNSGSTNRRESNPGKLTGNTNVVIFSRPRIIKTLSNIRSNPQQGPNSQMTRTVLQFRLAKMSFYLILLWLVSWTPIASLAMIMAVTKCPQASATAVFLASSMTKLGPALDVFIYGISHPKIKIRFKQIIGRLLFLNSTCSSIKRPR